MPQSLNFSFMPNERIGIMIGASVVWLWLFGLSESCSDRFTCTGSIAFFVAGIIWIGGGWVVVRVNPSTSALVIYKGVNHYRLSVYETDVLVSDSMIVFSTLNVSRWLVVPRTQPRLVEILQQSGFYVCDLGLDLTVSCAAVAERNEKQEGGLVSFRLRHRCLERVLVSIAVGVVLCPSLYSALIGNFVGAVLELFVVVMAVLTVVSVYLYARSELRVSKDGTVYLKMVIRGSLQCLVCPVQEVQLVEMHSITIIDGPTFPTLVVYGRPDHLIHALNCQKIGCQMEQV